MIPDVLLCARHLGVRRSSPDGDKEEEGGVTSIHVLKLDIDRPNTAHRWASNGTAQGELSAQFLDKTSNINSGYKNVPLRAGGRKQVILNSEPSCQPSDRSRLIAGFEEDPNIGLKRKPVPRSPWVQARYTMAAGPPETCIKHAAQEPQVLRCDKDTAQNGPFVPGWAVEMTTVPVSYVLCHGGSQ
ncbi:hypothetical protein Bbelb_225330 [Branchiostoma belcheri]|nr:hypothetical protein Bbelb_225330 [Branchiostoma belcheri]